MNSYVKLKLVSCLNQMATDHLTVGLTQGNGAEELNSLGSDKDQLGLI